MKVMSLNEAIPHCKALADESAKRARGRFRSDDARAIRAVLHAANDALEARATIAMLAQQIADKREIIRRLTS